MGKEALTDLLRNSTNLMTAAVANEIAEQFAHKSILRNQYQLAEGKICDEYLFLEKGYMRAFAHDTDGNEVTTGFFTPGQVIMEVSSFFARTRSKENIQALTDCEGWYLTCRELNDLFHQLPEFREFGRSVLVRGYSGLKARMLSAITETAEVRYAHLLATNADLLQHAPLKHIASYLGVTDTSLSRIRKEFSK